MVSSGEKKWSFHIKVMANHLQSTTFLGRIMVQEPLVLPMSYCRPFIWPNQIIFPKEIKFNKDLA